MQFTTSVSKLCLLGEARHHNWNPDLAGAGHDGRSAVAVAVERMLAIWPLDAARITVEDVHVFTPTDSSYARITLATDERVPAAPQ